MLIVQRNVALPPTTKPVTEEVGEEELLMVALPDKTVQLPVPMEGVLPDKVVVVTLHKLWSIPAPEVVGGDAILITISSPELVQDPLLIVHRNVAVPPTTRPVTPVVGEEDEVRVAVPDTTLQLPVPVVGVLPDKVAVVTLHKF